MISNKIVQFLTVAGLAAGLALPAMAQMPGPQEQPDEVDQLTQVLGLSEEQETEIRSVIDEISPKIDELQAEVQSVQEELQEKSGAGFDEDSIRESASRFGELTGEITALSVILQSKVQDIFTEEQRDELESIQQRQREMQQQMQQQQMQQQLQQQMQQQQMQQPQPEQGGQPQMPSR